MVEDAEKLTARVAAGEKLRTEALRRHKDGQTVWVAIAATPFGVVDQPGRVYAMYHDISARKHAEDELKALLLVDQLTGLPNRARSSRCRNRRSSWRREWSATS